MYVNEQTKNSIKAEILLDSINSVGVRLTTLVVTIPRIVLAEFNTHRKLSRNSASSRAIPFQTMFKSVLDNPFIPMAIQKKHSGMQGNEYLNEEEYLEKSKLWLEALDDALANAVNLDMAGVTKQITNRLLEPFMYHKILVTATSYDNFTALRAHEAAEIHIAECANKVLEALNNSKPKYLTDGQLHLPFLVPGDATEFLNSTHFQDVIPELEKLRDEFSYKMSIGDIYLALISAGKCAKVSYNNFDGIADHTKDFSLALKLVESGHWSPMEHIGINTPTIKESNSNFCAGWTQFRTLFSKQNMIDNRINKY